MDKECEYTETFRMPTRRRAPGNPRPRPLLCAPSPRLLFTARVCSASSAAGRPRRDGRARAARARVSSAVEEAAKPTKDAQGLEDDPLFRLANSTGNLLDDTR